MTATSDLDLIVVYDFDADHPSSDGERPLYGGQYFARLTQRLINALTTPTNQGVLYQVDMRLRPSGRSGPLATQIDGFASYQDREAWTWEHMALTRARVVSASPAICSTDRGGDPRGAVPRTRRRRDCRRRRRDAPGHRGRKGRRQPLGSQIRRGGAGRHRIHRAVSATRSCRAHARNSRYVDGARARQGVAARVAARRGCGNIAPCRAALSRSHPDFAALPVRASSIPKRQARACWRCWRAPPTCPISPRSRPMSRKRRRKVRRCFVRILGKAPY